MVIPDMNSALKNDNKLTIMKLVEQITRREMWSMIEK